MTAKACPFCHLPASRVVEGNEHAVWIYDSYPVSPGHSLMTPRRHVSSFFDITTAEHSALFALLEQAKAAIDETHHPDAYNIGINDGPCAGQTVPHLHIHLIPRYAGDVTDARGGVRRVIPDRADYWSDR